MIIESSPTNLDPRVGIDAQSERIDNLIFDDLLARGDDLNVAPGLAESWETPDAVTFTLDGRAWSAIGPPSVPDEPMALALQTQSWYCGHTWEACPDASTPPQVNLYVDWVVGYVQDG